jgi:predicted phage baseplate assembly protein
MTHSCSEKTCGCCEGTRKLTPVDTANRPGLSALNYRVGTHGTFFETMKARLATMTVDAPGADGQTIETFQTLRGLTTRNADDASIALLDGWATVGDILTFYQERIANEGYLRTATERRSVLELARLVGYKLRPGVSASVYLAYTLDDKATEPVEIPVGARSQSIPGPNETAQFFETSDPLIARSAWNNLKVRTKRPQNIQFENILSLKQLYVAGTDTKLSGGNLLLFLFKTETTPGVEGPPLKAIRTVASIEAQPADNRTLIKLAPLPLGTPEAMPVLDDLIKQLMDLGKQPNHEMDAQLAVAMADLRTQVYLGRRTYALEWPAILDHEADGTRDEMVAEFLSDLNAVITPLKQPVPIKTVRPDDFLQDLLKAPRTQVRNTLQLPRSLSAQLGAGSDAHSQLLVGFAPKLHDTLYTAWANATVNGSTPVLKAIYGFHVEAPIFGASAPKLPTYTTTGNPPVTRVGQPNTWDELELETDEAENSVFLDQPYEEIEPQSYAIIDRKLFHDSRMKRLVIPVESVSTVQRSAYGTTAKTTLLTLGESWRPELSDGNANPDLGDYRRTLIRAQSALLTPVDETITDTVKGKEIELAQLHDELTSGRWVIFSGERADITGDVAGVRVSELQMISSLRQDFDPNLPGDKTHTVLVLATDTAYEYKRDTLTIYGNVVKATHGETRNEPLGNGDGSRPLQSFELKQPPLTFVAAPNAAGVESTLKILVNDIEWHETDSLAVAKVKDRVFVTKTDDADKTTVIFGNGMQGSRVPTGVLNVNAVYRNGIGKAGNVKAEQISLLQTQPLGVNAVINPLRASGGADKESRDQARENAPLAVMSLDRLVSLQDYADFTRTFAGIAKADAQLLTDGNRPIVHLTIAGADDIPIDVDSDLYRNLLLALRELGSDTPPVQVDMRELIALVLAANVRLLPDYQWEPVATEIRSSLLDRFGFEKRALGQPALVCEIIAAIQQIEGVSFVDVDAFGGVPEKTTRIDSLTKKAERTLSTLTEIEAAIQAIIGKPPSTNTNPENTFKMLAVPTNPTTLYVPASVAEFRSGVLQPAQLAIFKADVQDTIVLNQIV